MTEIQNSKHAILPSTIDKSSECFGHWTFEFGYYLGFGYWDLGF